MIRSYLCSSLYAALLMPIGLFAQTDTINQLCANKATYVFKVGRQLNKAETELSDLAPIQVDHEAPRRKKVHVPPRMTAGVFGLMPLWPCPSGRPESAQDRPNYLIFDFEINEKGRLSKIRVHEYNEPRLRKILLHYINQSTWTLPLDEDNQPCPYQSDKWIIGLTAYELQVWWANMQEELRPQQEGEEY